MREVELALALSTRGWTDDLHRFLTDHGGARVRITATGPDDLLTETFDVLLIDDICSFLSPRLIESVRQRGRRVIGVYDPSEFPDGKERLIETGIHEVVESDAHPEEFLRAIGRPQEREPLPTPAPGNAPTAPANPSGLLAVGGPAGGVGATEVAVGLAGHLARRGEDVVLVDADDHAPSVAQRLGLALHPNLRTALDVLEHRDGLLDDAIQIAREGRFGVVAGVLRTGDWSEVRARQVVDLLDELTRFGRRLIVNVGSRLEPPGPAGNDGRHSVSRAVVRTAERVVVVGSGSPVGTARVLEWISSVRALRPGTGPVDLLVNRAPADSYRRGELVQELTRTYRPASLMMLPEDRKVTQAAWDGTLPVRGRFAKALGSWADRYLEPV